MSDQARRAGLAALLACAAAACAAMLAQTGAAATAHGGGEGASQRVRWTHLSSKAGDIPAPDVGRQVATLILDVDKDEVNKILKG